MSDERAIRPIVVAGGGIVGLSAAIAFARALPQAQVTVLETAADPAALADRLPTAWPTVARFHAALGLDERELLRNGAATHHLGTVVDGWPAGQWVHAFGPAGKPVGAIPFDQIWLRAHAAGKALPYDRYSLGAALARAGRFVHPSDDPDQLGSRFAYGLRFDPESYRERLLSQAQACRVELRGGEIADIEHDDDKVSALLLADGSRVAADLYVDCTGPRATLLSVIDDSLEDWSGWQPFDHVTIESAAREGVPAPADRTSADAAGWTLESQLPGSTMRVRVGSAGDVPVARHRRLRPWVGNVLALGDAATALDPLHGLNLELAQQAILLALELLPSRDFHPLETREYNRRAEQITRRARDFVALHYACGPWPSAAELPDSLARTLDQYRHRGRLPFHEEETVSRDSWAVALLNLGVAPRHAEPQAAGVPLDRAVGAMEQLAAAIDQSVAGLPDYSDYLARILR